MPAARRLLALPAAAWRSTAATRRFLGRVAGTFAKIAAPVVALLILAGLLLVGGNPQRPWVGPPAADRLGTDTGGRFADWKPPLSAALAFPPTDPAGGTPFLESLRTGGLKMTLAGRPAAFESADGGFAPPYPRRAWERLDWGLAASSYADVGVPGVAQRVTYLRAGGVFLAAFVGAVCLIWWAAAWGLAKRRENRGARDELHPQPGRLALLSGMLWPWAYLAAVAGAAAVTNPMVNLCGLGTPDGLAGWRVSAHVGPPRGFGEPHGMEVPPEPSGLTVGAADLGVPPKSVPPPPARFGAARVPFNPAPLDPGRYEREDRTVGAAGWRIGFARWCWTGGPASGERTGWDVHLGPWWAVAAGAVGSLLGVLRWRRDRADLGEHPL